MSMNLSEVSLLEEEHIQLRRLLRLRSHYLICDYIKPAYYGLRLWDVANQVRRARNTIKYYADDMRRRREYTPEIRK